MVDSVNCDDKITRASRCLPNEGLDHSFKTRPGYRPGPVIRSRVRRVDPGQQKKNTNIKHLTSYNFTVQHLHKPNLNFKPTI